MATKYTLISEDTEQGNTYGYPNTKVQVEFEATHIDEVLNAVNQFLLATGFCYRGKIELVEDETENQLSLPGLDLDENRQSN
ncbi:MAG: hypothetical protein EB023_02345 [Flavobacteriia bacterium]|nr:hypothetical protein [Flavobacteriia bacterium]